MAGQRRDSFPSLKYTKPLRSLRSRLIIRDRAPPPHTPAEPLPGSQPPSSSTTIPNSSAPVERPPVPQSPPAPEAHPPPVVHPPPDAASSSPLPKQAFTPAEQCHQLQLIFSRHPWSRLWGPRPTTFASALNTAALGGREKILNELFALGVHLQGNIDHTLPTTTPMHEALRGPKPWLAIQFLERHYLDDGQASDLLESKDANGCTPLHLAAQAGETAIATAFIDMHGAAVDPVDNIGRTPLHLAARVNRTEMIDMLLEHGADATLVASRLWLFDKRQLSAWEAKKREGLLGSFTFIYKTLQSASERRNKGGDKGAVHDDDGEGASERRNQEGDKGAVHDDDGEGLYVYVDDDEENVDTGATSTKSAVPSSSAASPQPPSLGSAAVPSSSGATTQPRSVEGAVAGPSAPRPVWGLGTPARKPNSASVGGAAYKQAKVAAREEADNARRREKRARKRAENNESALSSSEYAIWLGDVNLLLGESKRQKERNRREEEALLKKL